MLRSYPAVKYLQRVSTDGRSAEEVPAGQSTIMRLHPKTMVVDPPSWTSGTFRYDGSGNIYTIGVAGETAVTPHTYTYDNLSRLTQATNVTTQTEKFYYDIYGNMTEHDIGLTATMIALDPAHNNRLQAAGGITYDPVGNLGSDATAIYTYDPFSQLREKDFSGSTDNEIYLYAADDERIAVKQNDTWTWSIRDFGGKVLRQYQSSASQPSASWLWMEDYVYRDGLLLGADRPAEEGGRRYMHLDHLGTPRLVTGANGVKVAEHELAPFGIEPTPLWEDTTHGFDREDPMRFTGHERDFAQLSRMVTTPYLDYLHARFYNPNVGRFLSVDRAPGNTRGPQSWNRYSYGANNPIRFIDPNGLSYLVFIRSQNALSLYSGTDQLVGTWAASNHGLGKGPWPSGRFEMKDTTTANLHDLASDAPNGPYGPYGIFRAKSFYDPVSGQDRDDMGVHSGRTDKGGPCHPTYGCVRTTDDAMREITKTAANDPLQYIYVSEDEEVVTANADCGPPVCVWTVTAEPTTYGWSTIASLSTTALSGMFSLFEYSGQLYIDGVDMTGVLTTTGLRH